MAGGGGALLGIDLGGTNIKAARFSATGEREATARADTGAGGGAEALFESLCTAGRGLFEAAAPAGVGVGVAGVLDLREGRIVKSPNIPAMAGFALRDRVREAFGGVPVHMMNDANAAALGEYHAGAGAPFRSMFLLTLGTGVGGGFVVDGRIWEGVAAVAGEVGHMCIEVDGPSCSCGGRGCLEACVSGWALARDAQAAISAKPGSALARLPEITPRALAGLARSGDADAQVLWDRAGRMLGVGIANLMNLLNPECIVLAGGLAQAGELLMGPARRAWEKQAFERAYASTRVLIGELGEWAGVRGAIQPLLEA